MNYAIITSNAVTALNIAMTIATETLDGLAQALLTGQDPLKCAASGAITGTMLSLDSHLLYNNSIKHIHDFVDFFYLEGKLIDFTNKTPSDGFDDTYNLGLAGQSEL